MVALQIDQDRPEPEAAQKRKIIYPKAKGPTQQGYQAEP
jgi:hypothetical protein